MRHVIHDNPINDPRTYLVSTPLIPYYYTQLIGDARKPPTLLAAASFTGMAVIGSSYIYLYLFETLRLLSDADPYIPGGGGAQWYINQNNL